jgi:Yip1 domain
VGSERLIKFTEISAMQLSVLTYLAILVGVFALGYAINWMARTYGAREEQVPSRGIALASYSCTPLFLAGFALLYPNPWFNVIVFLVAACYGAWLMFDGLPIVMGIPRDQALMYAGALLTVALVILVSTRVGSVILWNYGFGPVYVNG